MEKNPLSHVDVRVPAFESSLVFYEALLPTLGFTRRFDSPAWKVFAAPGTLPSAGYIALTQDPAHVPNANAIGFWVEHPGEVDRVAEIVKRAGGTITAGPKLFPMSPTYYAVYFTDPCGNPYEVLHRTN